MNQSFEEKNLRKPRILIAPLDWGLGHATRCIPIIRHLLANAHTVTVAGSGDSLKLLQKEFPSLSFHELASYAPQYPVGKRSMVWKMAMQVPHFWRTIRIE